MTRGDPTGPLSSAATQRCEAFRCISLQGNRKDPDRDGTSARGLSAARAAGRSTEAIGHVTADGWRPKGEPEAVPGVT